jgi:hypothetical protein
VKKSHVFNIDMIINILLKFCVLLLGAWALWKDLCIFLYFRQVIDHGLLFLSLTIQLATIISLYIYIDRGVGYFAWIDEYVDVPKHRMIWRYIVPSCMFLFSFYLMLMPKSPHGSVSYGNIRPVDEVGLWNKVFFLKCSICSVIGEKFFKPQMASIDLSIEIELGRLEYIHEGVWIVIHKCGGVCSERCRQDALSGRQCPSSDAIGLLKRRIDFPVLRGKRMRP